MPRADNSPSRDTFASETIDRLREHGNTWLLPGGRIVLPEVFGFCRGVQRAVSMLDAVISAGRDGGGEVYLLGQIIHNPRVNEHFRRLGVRILDESQLPRIEEIIRPGDCAVIPAFGVPLPVERRLEAIGCRIVDTSCGDVRKLWKWTQHAAAEDYGVMIFGRAAHDETVVTKSRLDAGGGKYVVAEGLESVSLFAAMISGEQLESAYRRHFGELYSNATDIAPFHRLAQVSQTTMLYGDTIRVRRMLRAAYAKRFGRRGLGERLIFQPTVCRATQQRQSAAAELCRAGLDLAIVVGGFGSSNSRHLYELTAKYAPAYLIESAEAVRSADALATYDFAAGREIIARGWLPEKRPLTIGVLAGASSPEAVVGQVVEKLAQFLK